ncbi:hypothetical protein [Fluviicola taffensis]|uniref:hypothetical protein n=1 Tax=Fluviicola taffensis TaxID=191579 RepID=UPI0031377115
MKKRATFFLVLLMSASSSLFGQTRKESTVKLEWKEQGFVHFYTAEYSVYVSKPEFLNIQNELLIGMFDEYADQNDSINLKNPFSVFKPEQQNLLWDQLKECATAGHMLILPNHSKKKLRSVVIFEDKDVSALGEIWECRDPKTNHLIFSHNVLTTNPNF